MRSFCRASSRKFPFPTTPACLPSCHSTNVPVKPSGLTVPRSVMAAKKTAGLPKKLFWFGSAPCWTRSRKTGEKTGEQRSEMCNFSQSCSPSFMFDTFLFLLPVFYFRYFFTKKPALPESMRSFATVGRLSFQKKTIQ